MKRYTPTQVSPIMVENPFHGEYVKYEDTYELVGKLVSALNKIREIPNSCEGGDWDEIEEARKIVDEVLNNYE